MGVGSMRVISSADLNTRLMQSFVQSRQWCAYKSKTCCLWYEECKRGSIYSCFSCAFSIHMYEVLVVPACKLREWVMSLNFKGFSTLCATCRIFNKSLVYFNQAVCCTGITFFYSESSGKVTIGVIFRSDTFFMKQNVSQMTFYWSFLNDVICKLIWMFWERNKLYLRIVLYARRHVFILRV